MPPSPFETRSEAALLRMRVAPSFETHRFAMLLRMRPDCNQAGTLRFGKTCGRIFGWQAIIFGA
jgi:hypothetical protein